MADARPTYRVNNFWAGLFIVFALLCDLLQFLFSFLHVVPWVGNAIAFVVVLFITFFAYICLGLGFALLKVNYFSGKRAALKVLTILATIGIELIPLIDALPAITASTIVMVLVSRLEDATDLKAKQMTSVNLNSNRTQVLGAIASMTNPIGRARALAQIAGGMMPTPNNDQLINQESEESERGRNERAKRDEEKSPEYKKFREEMSGFRTDARKFTQENIDPSFYGIKREDRQQDYRKWRSRKANLLSKTRGKTVDIEKPEPTPNPYRE